MMRTIYIKSFTLLFLLSILIHQNGQTLSSSLESLGFDENIIIKPVDKVEIFEENNRLKFSKFQTKSHQTVKANNENEINSNEMEIEPFEPMESLTSTTVIRLLKKAFRFFNLKTIVKSVQKSRVTSTTCLACKIAMTGVKYLIDYGNGNQDVSYVTSYLCKTLVIQSDRVCDGYVEKFMEEFVFVMSQLNLSSNEICGFLLGDSCHPVTHPMYKWILPIPEKPFFRKSMLSFRWFLKFQQPQYFKILQISDLHIDLEYEENSNAVCGEPLCCRSHSPGSDSLVHPINKAGYWGDYRDCDIPKRTVEETFRFIRKQHPDIDYIIWTGDIPPHDIWNQTKESQLKIIDIAGKLFDKYFSNIPIYPVVGNHESLPMNSFPLPTHESAHGKYSKQWLYEKLSEIWLRWLPEDTKTTIERGAYFATRVKKGLKIVSINTNFCNNQNWWILLNATDPGQQLEWLIQQLLESERLGEMVQIIGHVPPGSNDCVQIWSKNYNRIINRFSSIIKGQFFGHTHNDEVEIFYKEVTPNKESYHDKTYMPVNVAYIGPSLTTFGNVNPGYRIYLVDQETYDIIDHQTYYLNLTEANQHRNERPLHFKLSYSARDQYGMNTLSPIEWHRLVMRMRTLIPRDPNEDHHHESDRLFRQFHKYFYNRSDNMGDGNKCDDDSCKYEMLCRLLTALSHDTSLCEHFLL